MEDKNNTKILPLSLKYKLLLFFIPLFIIFFIWGLTYYFIKNNILLAIFFTAILIIVCLGYALLLLSQIIVYKEKIVLPRILISFYKNTDNNNLEFIYNVKTKFNYIIEIKDIKYIKNNGKYVDFYNTKNDVIRLNIMDLNKSQNHKLFEIFREYGIKEINKD